MEKYTIFQIFNDEVWTMKSNLYPLKGKKLLNILLLWGFSLTLQNPVSANPVGIYEARVDHFRTGAQLNETILNTSNVNLTDFGLLFSMPVDNVIQTQPLYVPQLKINNSLHNVIYVMTSTAHLYAFDADQAGPPLWVRKLNPKQYQNPKGTPVIDPLTNTMYIVTSDHPYTQTLLPFKSSLYAIDILTGADKLGGPVEITASYTSPNGHTVNFTDYQSRNHAGLTIYNNKLVVTFCCGNEGNSKPYTGWVMTFDTKTLQLLGKFATITTPPATGGGIWQSGRPPAIDENGNIYLFVGNGYSNGNWNVAAANGYDGQNNFSESVLKFDTNLNLIDWFAPSSWAYLDANDLDTSSSGPTLIPNTNLLVGGGKDGNFYVWDRDNLGKYNQTDSQVIQKIPTFFPNPTRTNGGALYAGPVFWNRSQAAGGSLLFLAWSYSPIYALAFNGTMLNTTPLSSSPPKDAAHSGDRGYWNAFTLSANGDTSGTGIIWEVINTWGTNISVLRALDAENLSNELWNSSVYLVDNMAGSTEFIPPLVANGKVYAPTHVNQLMVYGLATINIITPPNQISKKGSTVNLAIQAIDSAKGPITFTAKQLPSGLTINPNTGVISGTVSGPTGTKTVTIVANRDKTMLQKIQFTWTVN